MALPTVVPQLSTVINPIGPFCLKKQIAGTQAGGVGSGSHSFGESTTDRVGQTFVGTGEKISYIRFCLYKAGAPVDYLTIRIYAVDGSGFPTGAALATSSTLQGAMLSVSPSWKNHDFIISFTPTNGVTYCAELTRSGATDSVNYYRIQAVGFTQYISGNMVKHAVGGAYTATTTDDFAFEVLSEESNGTGPYIVIGRDATTATTLTPIMATDPSAGWTAQTAATGFTTAILALAGYQTGNNVHMIIGDGTSQTSVNYKYLIYDLAQGLFHTVRETIASALVTSGSSAVSANCSIVVRSTGEAVVLFNGTQTKVGGNFLARSYYSRRTTAWQTPVIFDPATAAWDYQVDDLVLGDLDRVHGFLSKGAAHRSMSSANALDTTITTMATGSFGGSFAVSYIDSVGTDRLLHSIDSSSALKVYRGVSGANPTLTISGVDPLPAGGTAGGKRVFADIDNVYALYAATGNDMFVKKSTDFGDTWGAEQLSLAANITAMGMSHDGVVYRRGNNFVIPYVVNDAGAWKYNEYVTRQLIPTVADAWSAYDKTTNITLSNGDKTAQVTGSATEGVRSTQTRLNGTAGKYYVEFVVGAVKPHSVGLITTAAALTTGAGGWIFYRDDGAVYYETTLVGTSVSYAAGDVVKIAWNAGTKTIWCTKNNGLWNNNASADPATGVGGFSLSSSTSVEYALHARFGTNTAVATVRTEAADCTYVAPSGFTSWMGEAFSTADAWNVNDKSAATTLSNGDKTATGGTATAVRSTTGHLSATVGKYYAEIRLDNPSAAIEDVGLKIGSEAINSVGTYSATIATSSGAIRKGGTQIGSLGSAGAVGDAICIAWDTGAKQIWFRKNGGLWNNDAAANPATGANGLDVSTFTDGVSYHLWALGGVGGVSATVRTKSAEFTQIPPAGFQSWMGEATIQPAAGGWNVYDKTTTVTLSNSDKTVTCPTNTTTAQIRSTQTRTIGVAGKYYAECVINAVVPNASFGVIRTAPAITTADLYMSVGTVFNTGGWYINDGGVVVSTTPVTAGNIICIAFDAGAGKTWLRINNGLWNNTAGHDPVDGSGGFATSAVDTMALFASLPSGTTQLTIRTETAEFTQITPTGFLSWMGEVLGPPPDACIASPYVDSPPTVPASSIGQKHVWGSTSFAVAAPTIPVGVFSAKSLLPAPNGFAVATPTFTGVYAYVNTIDGWSVSDRAAGGNVVFSGSNKTVLFQQSFGNVRSTQKYTSGVVGKYYAECRHDAFAGVLGRFGIQDSTKQINQSQFGHWVYENGNLTVNGVLTGSPIEAVTVGMVTCIAWDVGAKKIWFRRDSGLWNANAAADPATGIGGLDVSVSLANPFALWGQASGVGTQLTVRARSTEFTQLAPTGFLSWMGEEIVTANYTARHFRWRKDAGAVDATPNWGNTPEDATSVVLTYGGATRRRLRFSVDNTGADATTSWSLRYSKDGGPYVALGSDVFSITDASSDADETPIAVQQLISGNGSWQDGVYDETGATANYTLYGNSFTEFEFGLYFNLALNSTYDFRLYAGTQQVPGATARAIGVTWQDQNVDLIRDEPTGVYTLTDTTTSGFHNVVSYVNIVNGIEYELYVEYKPIGPNPRGLSLVLHAAAGINGLANGTESAYTSVWTRTLHTITDVGGGWYGLRLRAISQATTDQGNAQLFLLSGTSNSFAGIADGSGVQFRNFAVVNALAAASFASSAPTLGAPAIGQKYVCIAVASAAGSPTINVPVLAQTHVLPVATALMVPTPTVGSAAFAQPHTLLAIAPVVPAPTINAGTFKLSHNLTATPLAASTLTLPAPAMTITVSLLAIALADSAPTVASTTFQQLHALQAIVLTVQPPTCTASSVTIKVNATALDLAITSPSLGAPPLSLTVLLSAANLATAPPVEAAALFAVRHALAAIALATNPPTIAASAFAQTHALDAVDLAVIPPLIAAASIGQAGVLAALPIAVGQPTIGVGTLGQKHILLAAALTNPSPALSYPALIQKHPFTAIAIAVTPPTITAATLKQLQNLAAAPLTVGSPALPTLSIALFQALTPNSIAVASPTISASTFAEIHSLQAVALAVQPPVFGTGVFKQTYVFTANALTTLAPLIAIATLGQAGVMAALPIYVGQPIFALGVLGQKQVLAATNLTIIAPPAFDAIAEGAAVHVDFVGVTGYVRGVGNVGVNTLIGKDSNSDWIMGTTAYYPEGLTQYGYDYNNTAAVAAGGYPPCFIGALRSAVMSGKSVVIKLQSTGSALNNNVFQIYINAFQSFNGVYVESYGNETVGLDAGDNAGGSFELDAAGFHRVPQGVAGIVNAIGFSAITANRLDFTYNNFDAKTTPLVNTGEALAVGVMNVYGAIASITAFDTLSLADLKAKTTPILYGVVSPPLSIGQPALQGYANFIAIPTSAGAPALGQPAITKKLTATSAVAGAPILSKPALGKVLAAANLADSAPTIGEGDLGQRHGLIAAALTIVPPVVGAAAISQAGVLAAIPIAAGAPVCGVAVFVQNYVLAANFSAIIQPVLSTPEIGQEHLIAAIFPATIAPVFGGPSLGQKHVLPAAAVTTSGAPAFSAAVMSQAGQLASIPIAISTIVFSQPAFNQRCVLTAQPAKAGAPTIGASALGQVLEAEALAVSAPALGAASLSVRLTAATSITVVAPTLGTPTLRAFKEIAAANHATSAPVIGAPAIKQVHKFVASIDTVSPVLPVLTLGIVGIVTAVPVKAGVPVFSVPTLTQFYRLAAANLIATAPIAGVPAFKINIANLDGGDLTVAGPTLGQPAVGQRHSLVAVSKTVARPSIPAPFLGQAGVMAAVPLVVGAVPTTPVALSQRHRFTGNKVAAGAPELSNPTVLPCIILPRPWDVYAGRFKPLPAVLGQDHQLDAQAASAGAPTGLLATLYEREGFGPVSLGVLPPVLGAPALVPIYSLTAPGHVDHGPVLGAPELGQEHELTARSLVVGRPQFTRPRPAEPAIALVDPIGIVAEAPELGAPVLQTQRAPRGNVVNIRRIIGKRSGVGRIIGRKSRSVI
jgi:hypothetical protein